jgi:TPR repeat protein
MRGFKYEAQYNLGLMYEDAAGISRNYPEAVKWYKLAAAQQNPQLMGGARGY